MWYWRAQSFPNTHPAPKESCSLLWRPGYEFLLCRYKHGGFIADERRKGVCPFYHCYRPCEWNKVASFKGSSIGLLRMFRDPFSHLCFSPALMLTSLNWASFTWKFKWSCSVCLSCCYVDVCSSSIYEDILQPNQSSTIL